MRIICFLLIGDGMSYPQFQAASDYLGAIADEDYVKALPSNSYEDRGGAVLDGPEAGYKVTYTQADAEAVTAEGGKIDWACHANDAGAKDKTEDLHKMIKEYKFAITPPMGWNSYDYYDTTVNEEQVKKNA